VSDTDRRAQVISLTDLGRAEFRAMAAEHEAWIADVFAGLTRREMEELMRLLGKAKAGARRAVNGGDA
jgi:DNA-binding MarR family transcriptional regulator